MSDPYFQQLFAQRIGGVNYGKGTKIDKFEKIKRAKRKALAEHPSENWSISASARTTRWPMRRSARDGQGNQPPEPPADHVPALREGVDFDAHVATPGVCRKLNGGRRS